MALFGVKLGLVGVQGDSMSKPQVDVALKKGAIQLSGGRRKP